ncbi:hypothetical protein [Thalassotalea maritima]|uniref:hypothetical protein n=1 Tax=Thalassotalea maritima TaxID=3242416 RepID=UPI003527560E
MKKVYCYASLIICFSFLFQALQTTNFIVSALLFLITLLISSKAYIYQEGEVLAEDHKNLPILRISAFIFRDKEILNAQNSASLRVLMLTATLGLSMIICFSLYGHSTKHYLLFIGCLMFSILFTTILLRHYAIGTPD